MLDNGKAEGVRKIKRFEKYCLKDIATVSQGFTFSRLYQGKKNLKWNYFKVADIGLNPNSKYLTNAINTISDITMEEIGALPFSKGSIVFPRVGAALFNNNKKILAQDGVVDDNVLVLTVTDTSKCWYEFLYYYLQGIPLAKWCNSGLVPVINTKTVLSQMVFLPPLPEQQKIAAILSTQDKVIELKEKLLVQKQQQKKYLMQQLLTGKLRLPDVNGEWTSVKLKELLIERNEKNAEQNHRICSVAVSKGVVDQIEHLGRSYAAADTSNYGVAHYGDIIYTKSPTGDFSLGIIKQNRMRENVAISPLYGIYKPISFSTGYLLNIYFESTINTKNYLTPIVQKGAKNTIAISNSAFLENKIFFPMDEATQSRIAKVFELTDHEIDLLHKSIEAEKQKKKALMQLLLTGKVSVRI